jgi:hypothetical protein
MKHHLSKEHSLVDSELSLKRSKMLFSGKEQADKLLYVLFFVTRLICTLIFRAHFVAEAHISLISIENQSFLDLIQLLQPLYQVPSRHQLRDNIMEEAAQFKKKVSQ